MLLYIFTFATIDFFIVKDLVFFTVELGVFKHSVFLVTQSGIQCSLSDVHRRVLVNRVNNS